MPILSDQLKALGVKIGANRVGAPEGKNPHSVLRVIPGREVTTSGGATYVVETAYASEFLHGDQPLRFPTSRQALALWANETRACTSSREAFAFLDIETTGLSGGTGTYAFLVGVGRFQASGYTLAQFFLRDPAEEPAHLLALEEFLSPCEVIVTFNGKSFDIPLLNTRYLAQGWKPPFASLAHLDLLHLARRLWRERLPSRTLGSLEINILGHRRTEEDIPGWLVPQLYFDYIHTGDARPLTGVFYHNAMDVVSLAGLLRHMADVLEDPLHAGIEHDLDWAALGRLFDDLGRGEDAIRFYRLALGGSLPPEIESQTRGRLAQLHKRRGEWDEAISQWVVSAARGEIPAYIELAKVYEHQRRAPSTALHWAQIALECVLGAGFPPAERAQWEPELTHRIGRLQTKASG